MRPLTLLLTLPLLAAGCRGAGSEATAPGLRFVVETDAGNAVVGEDEYLSRLRTDEDRCAANAGLTFVRAYRYAAFFDGRQRPGTSAVAVELALAKKDACFDPRGTTVDAGLGPVASSPVLLHLTDDGRVISRADRAYGRLAGRRFVLLFEYERAVPSLALRYGHREEKLLVAESGPEYAATKVQVSALVPEGDAAGRHWWAFFDAVDIPRADGFVLVAADEHGAELPCVPDGALDLEPATNQPRRVDESSQPLVEPWRHGVVLLLCSPKVRIARIGRQERAQQDDFARTISLSPAARAAIRNAFEHR